MIIRSEVDLIETARVERSFREFEERFARWIRIRTLLSEARSRS